MQSLGRFVVSPPFCSVDAKHVGICSCRSPALDDLTMLSSLLYVPITNDRFLASAARSDPDVIILDLEDSIPASDKEAARLRLSTVVPMLVKSGKRTFVRVNHCAQLLEADTRAAATAGANGLVIPKVEDPAVLADAARFIELAAKAGSTMPVIPLIESPRGILNADAIAAYPQVMGMICGSEDLATSMNARPSREFLRVPKMLVHLAAKANRKLSFGLLQTIANYKDLDQLAQSIDEAKKFGFDGTTCIHPSALPLINKAFRIGVQEKERAQRLIKAADANAARGVGAFLFEGDFIDEAMIKRARWLLNP